ncbi:MAG: helix-turn-helix transcriptional regulator [Bacilli bacterium]
MNIEIANRLVKLRKEKGLSQEELADKLGISRQSVSKWERAESSPDTDNLICLAKIYGVSLDELLQDDETIEEIAKDKKERLEKEKKEEDDESTKAGVHIDNGILKTTFIRHDKRTNSIVKTVEGCLLLIAIAIYLILGFLLQNWTVGICLFFIPFVIGSFIRCIYERKISLFNISFFIETIYVFIGTYLNIWHPTWIMFVLIPLFYSFSTSIDSYLAKKRLGIVEDDVIIDED